MSSAADSRKQTFKVRIFNQAYTITSSAGEAEFLQIADTVDHLMQTIASRSGSADGTRAAVMAALHLADKLRQMERRVNSLQSDQSTALAQVSEHTDYLERLLRETLEMEDLAGPVPLAEPSAMTLASLADGPASARSAHLRVEPVAVAKTPAEPVEAPAPAAGRGTADAETAIASSFTPKPRPRKDRDPSLPTLFPMGDADAE